jgi:carbamoyl-phosphate synthase large subunit
VRSCNSAARRPSNSLEQAGIPILGTSGDSIDLAEDRDRFKRLLDKIGLKQPMNGIAYSVEQSRLVASDLGLPLVVRPSYVLGGRAMAIIFDNAAFDDYLLGTLPSLVPAEVKARYPNDKTGRQANLHLRHHGAHRGGRNSFWR